MSTLTPEQLRQQVAEAEARRQGLSRAIKGKPFELCTLKERAAIDAELPQHLRDAIRINDVRRAAMGGFAPAPSNTPDSYRSGNGHDLIDLRRCALNSAPESVGRSELVERLALTVSIPLQRAVQYLGRGPSDPSPDARARRAAGMVPPGLDSIDRYLDQIQVEEHERAQARTRAIVDSKEGRDRPALARYMVAETNIEAAACIAFMRKAPVEPSADEVARRIAGAAPDSGRPA